MLVLKNLNKIYQLKQSAIHAVQDVDLTFHRGEFVSILGLSGSGKTTLVSLIGGLEEPSYGQFFIDNIDTSTFNKSRWTDYRKNTIGFVFQDFNLIDHLTAIDNIKIALSLSGFSEIEKETRATELLEMVNMSSQRDQFPAQLSGGQQQRIAIARALANEPEIILADEPTGALDPKTSVQIMGLLQELADKGHLVIMVTHNGKIANTYSSRIVEIESGVIIKDTSMKDVNKQEFPPIEMAKSSLQLHTALKVSVNNLKIRKKSSLFAIISLIPSIIMVILLGNFAINLGEYQEDIDPIYKNIITGENIHFVSTLDEKDFENELNNLMTNISKKNYKPEKVQAMEEALFKPYTDEELKTLTSLPFVEAVFKPNYYNIDIDGESFILVGLLPEAYKDYQNDFDFGYYPNDDDEGLILSVQAAEVLLGKYNNNPMKMENTTIDFEVNSFNSLPLHHKTRSSDNNNFSTQVLKVFDPEVKTTLMSSYYKGYIYAPYGYINDIRSSFSQEDISLIAYELVDVKTPEGEQVSTYPLGSTYLTDLLLPLRAKTMLQEDMELFSIKEHSIEAPSNNFMLRHRIITTEPLDDEAIHLLGFFGNYYTSQFDDSSIYSAENTNSYIKQLLLYTKIAVAVIVSLPSILVALILYISIILRTKEIGVLKSIGAKSKDIMTIFTFESGLLAVFSGLVALVFSFPVINFAREKLEAEYHLTYYLGSNPLDINYYAIFISLISIVTLITLLGLLPGRKASKLHPRVLLRRIN